ncbi:hypothetical protein MGI18_23150 [Bacillus sp. OVS6]|nr:hypothetical protein MGI18_23150 [Bacillus sp. OVS6]
MSNSGANTNIYAYDGSILSTGIGTNQANTNTNIPIQSNTNNNLISQTNSTNNQPTHTIHNQNTNTSVLDNTTEQRYEYSFQEISRIIEEQINGKLQDHKDENERKISLINGDVRNHKDIVDTKVHSLQTGYDGLTNNRFFGISTIVGLAAIMISAIVTLIPLWSAKVDQIDVLSEEVAVVKSKLEDIDNNSNEEKQEIKTLSEKIDNIILKVKELELNK